MFGEVLLAVILVALINGVEGVCELVGGAGLMYLTLVWFHRGSYKECVMGTRLVEISGWIDPSCPFPGLTEGTTDH